MVACQGRVFRRHDAVIFFDTFFPRPIEEFSQQFQFQFQSCNGFSSPLGMSRFVSSLAVALLILLDGFAPSRMAWHHGATDLKTTRASSHRRLKDELLTDSMASVDPRHFPEIPNLLRAPSCPGDWQHMLSLTYWLVAVLCGCCVFIVSFVIAACVEACLEKHGCCCCGDLLVEWWCLKLVSFWGGPQGVLGPLQDAPLCAPLNSLRNRFFQEKQTANQVKPLETVLHCRFSCSFCSWLVW